MINFKAILASTSRGISKSHANQICELKFSKHFSFVPSVLHVMDISTYSI